MTGSRHAIIMLLMSSTFRIPRSRWAPKHALMRVFLNTVIAYAVVAVVTFMSIAVALLVAQESVFIPSEYGPLLGGTIYVTGVLAFGLPIVIAGSAVLDYILQPRRHPRLVVAVLAVVQALFWYATSHGEAPMFAVWTLVVGLVIARIMFVPGSSEPHGTTGD